MMNEHKEFKEKLSAYNTERAEERMREEVNMPKKDRSVKLEKIYEFQFYENYEALTQFRVKIQKIVDSFETVPQNMKDRLEEMLDTGFRNWSFTDFRQFFNAFLKRELDDIEGIASEVASKSFEEVTEYMKVFVKRF